MKKRNTFVAISIIFIFSTIILLPTCYAGEAEKWYEEGVKYADYHKYGKALECLNKAISLKPDFAMAYNERGYVFYELIRYEEAIADYTKSISLDPDYPGAYYNRAVLFYFELEDYEAVILDSTECIKRDPDYANSYALRGLAYKKIGKLEEALEDLTKGCELGSRDACSHLKLLKKEMGLIQK